MSRRLCFPELYALGGVVITPYDMCVNSSLLFLFRWFWLRSR